MFKFKSFISLDERVKSGDNYGNNENQTYSSCLVGFDVFEPNARKQRDENHFVIYNSH